MENLYIKSYKKHFEHSYALGATLVFCLLQSRPQDALLVYVHSSFTKNESYQKLIDLCRRHNIDITVSDKLINRLSPKENVFVIGVFRKFSSPLTDSPLHIALDNPSNSGNLGTIMRTMLGFGVRNLAIIGGGTDIFDPKAVRASMGAVFDINCEHFGSFDDYLKRCPDRIIYPFMLGGNVHLDELDIDRVSSSTLVFGNEATGLPESYTSVGTPVRIRCSSAVDSFNLGIAASVAIYEFTKGTVI